MKDKMARKGIDMISGELRAIKDSINFRDWNQTSGLSDDIEELKRKVNLIFDYLEIEEKTERAIQAKTYLVKKPEAD